MARHRSAAVILAVVLAAALISCGRKENGNNAGAGASSDQVSAESADTELDKDSEQEEAAPEEAQASTDLFFDEGDVCTQFIRLIPPEEWDGGVTYHYFQEPETGRYALDIIENSSMTAFILCQFLKGNRILWVFRNISKCIVHQHGIQFALLTAQ